VRKDKETIIFNELPLTKPLFQLDLELDSKGIGPILQELREALEDPHHLVA